MTNATLTPAAEQADSTTSELTTVSVPSSALSFEVGAVQLAAGDGKQTDEGKFTFPAVIRTTAVLNHWYWGPFVHDFEGMSPQADRMAVNWRHADWSDDDVLGYFENFKVEGSELSCDVTLTSTKDDDTAATIAKKMAAGVPYGLSIEFPDLEVGDYLVEYVGENELTQVNGVELTGPLLVFREWPLRGLALCRQGYDPGATAQLSADSADHVSLSVPEGLAMNLFGKSKSKSSLAGTTGKGKAPAKTTTSDSTETGEGDDSTADDETSTETESTESESEDETETSVETGEGNSLLSAPKPTGDPMKDAANLSQHYAAKYGERGATYLSKGMSLEEAEAAENVHLRAELSATTKRLDAIEKRLEQAGESNKGLSAPVDTHTDGEGDQTKRRGGSAVELAFAQAFAPGGDN